MPTVSVNIMNKVLITCSVLASLGVAAVVTSFASEAVNAQEIGPTSNSSQPLADRDDCSSQVWPNFSQSCLKGRNTQVTVRNVNVRMPERR